MGKTPVNLTWANFTFLFFLQGAELSTTISLCQYLSMDQLVLNSTSWEYGVENVLRNPNSTLESEIHEGRAPIYHLSQQHSAARRRNIFSLLATSGPCLQPMKNCYLPIPTLIFLPWTFAQNNLSSLHAFFHKRTLFSFIPGLQVGHNIPALVSKCTRLYWMNYLPFFCCFV